MFLFNSPNKTTHLYVSVFRYGGLLPRTVGAVSSQPNDFWEVLFENNNLSVDEERRTENDFASNLAWRDPPQLFYLIFVWI